MKKLSLFLAFLLAVLTLAPLAIAQSDVSLGLLTVNNRNDKSSYNTALYNALDAFKAESGLEVAEEAYPDQTAYQQKVYTLAAADDLPAVFRLKGSWMTEFVSNGWALDLTEIVEGDSEWKAIFNPGAFNNFTRDGKVYGIPDQSMVTSVVYWNKALFAQAGIEEFPKSFEDLIAAAAKFEALGIPMFCLGNKANWPAESCWLSTLGNFGTGHDWTASIVAKDGAARFTDAGFVTALTKFQQLAQTPNAMNADINSLAEDLARETFMNGKCAALVEGTWFISTLEKTAPPCLNDIEVTILPQFEGATGSANEVSGGPAWSMALSKRAKASDAQYEAATKLIKRLLSADTFKEALEGGGIMAATVEFDNTKLGPIMLKYLEMMKDKTTVPIYDACMESAVIETMNVGLQEVLVGAKTPEALAEEIQREQDMA